MFIELVDSLRCVASHEDTWLVASADRMEGRRIVEGTLGCPTCRATYAIRDGVAWIGAAPGAESPGDAPPAAHDVESGAARLAALLDLRDPGTRAVLTGAHGHLATAIVAMTSAELVLVDPPAGMRSAEGVSVVRSGGRLPLADGSMRGAALDARASALAVEATRVIRDGGRIVAPVAVPLPDAVTELARDEHEWVGERRARPSAPVQLSLVRKARHGGPV